jgi:hypothetical protein
MWTLATGLVVAKETALNCALYCQGYSKCVSFSFGSGECRPVGDLTGAMNASLLITATGHVVYDLVYIL